MKEFDQLKEEARQYIRYEKDKSTKIATLTFVRPDKQNATTIGMRQVYADLVHQANIDDDVKVLVLRGEGKHFGAGGDLPEQDEMLSASDEDVSLLHEFGISNKEDVKYPPKNSYRFLHGLTDHYAKLPMMTNDKADDVQLGDDVFGKGLNNIVKDNDMNYPPDWRLSYGGRAKKD